MRKVIMFAATSMMLAASLPTAVWAGDRDQARMAIAAAKAKIDLNEKNGVTGAAADVQGRARAALERAEVEFKKSDEHDAKTAADEASALADLAAATQQKQAADDQLATAEPR